MPNGARLSESNVKFFLRLGSKYHRQYGLPPRDKEDRIQTAVAAVIRLAKRYDGPAPFLAVAALRIKYEIMDCAKKYQRRREHKFEVLPAFAYDSEIKDTRDGRQVKRETADEVDHFKAVDVKDFIDTLLSRVLNHKHRCALALIAAGMTHEQAATTVGMSPARIPQLMHSKFKPLARVLIGEVQAV